MINENDYIQHNRDLWNEKTKWHVDSDFYANQQFIAGENSLNEPELKLLRNVHGKSILHLQCHFGQDSISLSRMGAEVTGVDLSDKAIEAAQKLAKTCATTTHFICSDVFELPAHLDKKFDIVFTSYGTIGWLPDLQKWASIIDQFLKPGGRFIFAEFHPVVWMYDNDFSKILYPYFKKDAIIEEEIGTYANKDAPIKSTSITWNHGLAEVISSLLNCNLQITSFDEYDYSPYNCFQQTEEFETGKFRIIPFKNNIPLMYTISALKSL